MAEKTAAKTATAHARLRTEYATKYVQELQKELELANVHQVPRLQKIVVNVGLGRAKDDKKVIETATNTLRKITGQEPVKTYAKNSIAGLLMQQAQVAHFFPQIFARDVH